MGAGIVLGIRAAGPEVGGLLLAVALVVVSVRIRGRLDAWRTRRRPPVVRTVRRQVFASGSPLVPVTAAESSVPPLRRVNGDPAFPRRMDPALAGHDPLAAPRLPRLRTRRPAPPPRRRLSPVVGLVVAAAAIVALVAAVLAVPGPPGLTAVTGLAVLILAWVGAVVVVASVAERRDQVARYRGLHAAGGPLLDRGRCTDYLVIPEVLR
ncbi:hypothetical protein OOK41_01240 [Micromonospora sp. NBC_01655]|uniref:hypothetical protein n=1 Tax=Micromonospora sp. NBC_01655 TaxID=2975983 RepID=UPI0022527A47|nr:hypothetical protein [Micromonospora sp. NBC_01655]MCX4468948.1 hypothetical protein [Micromonospora sp. NBC_01655]